MEKSGFCLPLMVSGIIGLIAVCLSFTVQHDSLIIAVAAMLAVFGINNGIQNIGLQNLLFSFVGRAESGIAVGLLMTSRYLGNILASNVYEVTFATGMNDGNMQKMTIVILVVAFLIIPGMVYVTRHKRKGFTKP